MVRWRLASELPVASSFASSLHAAFKVSEEIPPFRTSPHAVIFRVSRVSEDGSSGYLKLFPGGGILPRAKDVLRGSLALRSWRGNRILRREGILVPDILALGPILESPWGKGSFVLEREVPGERLYAYFQSHFPVRESMGSLKKALLRTLARLVSGLHSRGVFHGDLQSSNVLVSGPVDHPCLFFLDTLKVRRASHGAQELAMDDLKQLNQTVMPELSLADRLSFLEAYLPGSPLDGLPFRELVSSLIRVTEERLGQKNRSLFERWRPVRSEARG